METKSIKINVPVLARVEGEGALDLAIDNNQITDLKLRIYEPPRYFEKFLEGRNYYDVPDMVARICGICPVAYQMSATHAIESVFGTDASPWLRSMRRLFYCGEWLQSHSLHVHLLAVPDFLGFNSVIEMSAKFGDEVRRGLKLQAIGNDLVALFGARSVHPVGVKVGGFTRAPDKESVNDLLQRVTAAKQDAVDLVHWLDSFNFPEDEQDFISVALHHESEYPFNEGRLLSDHGLDIDISEFENHFREHHVDHSTALHCLLDGEPYLVGPLARLNLNKQQLPTEVQSLMQELDTQFPSKNMFHSLVARGIEIYFCLLEAERLLSGYKVTDKPCMEIKINSGIGYGCTEAPRGILWHRYEMDKEGCVVKATIVPPTSQNQPRIEQDLKASLLKFGLDKAKAEIQLHAEKVIRNYDPCISCATHFLDLNLNRDTVTETDNSKGMTSFKNSKLSEVLIIGVGSPQANDDLAWQTIDLLQANKKIKELVSRGLTLLKRDRPGISLIQQFEPYQHVIIIDAVKPAKNNLPFVLIDSADYFKKLNSLPAYLSSHQAGVIDSVKLLDSLECVPENMVIFAVSEINDDLVGTIIDLF